RAVNENNATKQAELKDLIKQHKVEISTVNEKLAQAEKEKKALCADAKISATLEKQLMAEVDRLQEQLKQVKRDQSAADKVVAKRTSDASLLNQ
uniref:Uncharacterized protein n=1 Tax=Ciona savignyi TaxID=51511 RepID=H2ZF17_CIOSA